MKLRSTTTMPLISLLMNRFLILGVLLNCFLFTKVHAQEPLIEKGFVILYSTEDYKVALKVATVATNRLNIDLNLRGYYADEEKGLKTDTVCDCGAIHEYIPRGRFDDGVYTSIEYSDRYTGFEKGYYIVIMASGPKGSKELTKTLRAAKKLYEDAYIKNTSVYIGCMH